jgi:DNA-binding protein H-NS
MNLPRTLSNLSFKDLSELERKVASEMVKRYEATEAGVAKREADLETKSAELRSRLARMATDLNSQTEKVFGKPDAVAPELKAANGNGANGHTTKKRRKGKRVPVQFRDPSNPANTWSGRGKQAAWLTAAIKAGRTLNDFRISK